MTFGTARGRNPAVPVTMNVDLVLPRDTATVPLVRHLLKYSLMELGVRRECVADVELAVTEACANVVEHAASEEEYRISFSFDGDLCEIRVVDSGGGFVPGAQPRAMPAGDSEGGRGLLLMQALVDQLHFESAPEVGTVVRLVKTLEFAAPVLGS